MRIYVVFWYRYVVGRNGFVVRLTHSRSFLTEAAAREFGHAMPPPAEAEYWDREAGLTECAAYGGA